MEIRSSAAPQNQEIRVQMPAALGPPGYPLMITVGQHCQNRGREALRSLQFKVLSQVAPELTRKGKLLLVAQP